MTRARKGVLAQTHDIDVDLAYDILRKYARNHNRKVIELAHAIVTDPVTVPALTRHRPTHT